MPDPMHIRDPCASSPVAKEKRVVIEGLGAPRGIPFLPVANVAVWLLLSVGLTYAVRHFDQLTRLFTPGWLAALIFAVCVALFYVRRFFRFAYAGLEIALGIVLVLDMIQGPAPDPSKLDEPIIKLAGGMYLVIRGIDNLMHWLKPKLRDTPAWIRYIFSSE